MAKKRRTRAPLSLDELKGSMSTALLELERMYMDTKQDPELRIRAINSLSTLVNSYVRLSESHDLEKRITELEDKTNEEY